MVQFYTLEKVSELRERKRLKAFLDELAQKEGRVLSLLTVVLCSDDYLLKLNLGFLKHDYYTDIVTFDMSESSDSVAGEIYISIDRVRDNAKQLAVKPSDELLRVIFHGLLHLCGYKDKLKADKQAMRKKEDYYLMRYSN